MADTFPLPTVQLLASASYDDTVKLFAADPYDDEWSCVETLTGHTATVWSISFSPCGNYLASAGDDLVIKIWGRDRKGGGVGGGDSNGQPEAVREEGGRMGPWSSGGVRIGVKERWNWSLKAEIRDAHTRTIYAVDWAPSSSSSSSSFSSLPSSNEETVTDRTNLGRLLTCGGDGRINVYQIVSPARLNVLASVSSFTGTSS